MIATKWQKTILFLLDHPREGSSPTGFKRNCVMCSREVDG